MVVFEKASDYFRSCSDNRTMITAIDAVITALIVASAAAAESGHIQEYWFDDGQVKIRNNFRNPADIPGAIQAYRRLRNDLVQENTGRIIKLIDGKNLNGNVRNF